MSSSPDDVVDVRHVSNASNSTIELSDTPNSNTVINVNVMQRQVDDNSESTDSVNILYEMMPCLAIDENRIILWKCFRYVMALFAVIDITVLAIYQLIHKEPVFSCFNKTSSL